MNTKEIAEQIKLQAEKLNWHIEIRNSVLTIKKYIPFDDNDAFCRADSEYYLILGLLPTTQPGSIWGTDGSGIGALSAIKSGVFVMNKSGGSKRILSALSKII